jgi:hypothetical protein
MEDDKTRPATRILSAAAVASLLAILASPAFTMTTLAQETLTAAKIKPTPGHKGAPGPIVGAGLPILAIGVGYGVYWLVKRRRQKRYFKTLIT